MHIISQPPPGENRFPFAAKMQIDTQRPNSRTQQRASSNEWQVPTW